MYAFIQEHLPAILVVTMVCAVIFIVICIIKKLFQIAIGLFIATLIIPILFTVFWGDGARYVSQFASLFEEPHKQQIEQVYEYYKKKDAEDPFVNADAVSDQITHTFDEAKQHILSNETIQEYTSFQSSGP